MKLMLFVPCEKVIVAEQTHAISVITVMSGAEMRRARPDDTADLPPTATIPMPWVVVALWKPSNDDLGKSFIQRLEILWPNKTQFATASIPFVTTDDKMHPVYANLTGFPGGQVGDVLTKIWLEQNGERITEIFEYPVKVIHKLESAPSPVMPLTQ
jgi:hypothetical protein